MAHLLAGDWVKEAVSSPPDVGPVAAWAARELRLREESAEKKSALHQLQTKANK